MPGLDMTIEIKNGLTLTEIRIWPTRDANASRVKAMVSLTFNGVFRVSKCRIIDGAKGLFLLYPSVKIPGSENWENLAHAINRETSDKTQEAVLKMYRSLVEGES